MFGWQFKPHQKKENKKKCSDRKCFYLQVGNKIGSVYGAASYYINIVEFNPL